MDKYLLPMVVSSVTDESTRGLLDQLAVLGAVQGSSWAPLCKDWMSVRAAGAAFNHFSQGSSSSASSADALRNQTAEKINKHLADHPNLSDEEKKKFVIKTVQEFVVQLQKAQGGSQSTPSSS